MIEITTGATMKNGRLFILDLRKPTTPPKPNQAAKIPFSPVSVSTNTLPVEKRDFISPCFGLDRCAILRKSSMGAKYTHSYNLTRGKL
ncbi:MAG: hypothetical protein UT66_C0033G0006 [candidate division CPR2 bacterium GW2011_GWC1_39_9]|uniref:Uncharacterized protein n=1 Tax=candidate division CPR2 bacterium GW2011_GWC2_39_10 TaxID=1618345 RepID=A0A0G0PWW3_UNCC2|nr:MAG: hypothetical protein UT18_C0015G0015 [candidate division CPR2 bacterium GW2011_GWC2_39_10]KKR33856.1 MAG: hypothetical protein UT66_C0033G0006 [candidate division CPR2 bacterium GW2011_GWC1_39_9]